MAARHYVLSDILEQPASGRRRRQDGLEVCAVSLLATGRNLTGEHVHLRCRVLVISLEDDENELKRRMLALMKYHESATTTLGAGCLCRRRGARRGSY